MVDHTTQCGYWSKFLNARRDHVGLRLLPQSGILAVLTMRQSKALCEARSDRINKPGKQLVLHQAFSVLTAIHGSSCSSAGSGTDLSIDTFHGGPYGLLSSNNDYGYGSRPWGMVGTAAEASSFNTIWNMHSYTKVGVRPLRVRFWGLMR